MAEAKHSGAPADSQVMNRRNLLAVPFGAALVAAAGAYAAGAAAAAVPGETQVMALFREWQAAKADEDAVFAAMDDDAARDKAWDNRYDVEDRMMQEPCKNALDWALKLCAWTNFGEADAPDAKERPQLWAEARALVGEV